MGYHAGVWKTFCGCLWRWVSLTDLPITLKECDVGIWHSLPLILRDKIEEIMTMTDEMTTDGGDNDNSGNGNEDGGGANRWMWHAGAVAKLMTSTLAIYCPPSNADRVGPEGPTQQWWDR